LELVGFWFVGLGSCGFKAARISRFIGVHHCDEGIIIVSITSVNLKFSAKFLTQWIDFVAQLVSLAQEGHEITSDLLKGSSKWKITS